MEQVLPPGGVCLLGSLNLTQFVSSDPNKVWDFEKLEKVVPVAVRFLDNVNDISYVPLEQQKQNMKKKRRIGLGVLGYASALLLKKIPYGSQRSIKVTEELMSFLTNLAYRSSVELAKEKGPFELFDREKYLNSKFVKSALTRETQQLIAKHGIRNSHLTSIQPTGNSSVYANNVSGGLEPIFMTEYIRTSIFPYPPEGLKLPKNIDYASQKYNWGGAGQNWEWIQEGDTNLLKTEFGGFTWKLDQNRGLLRETLVQDYAVRVLKERGEWNPQADYVRTTTSLSVKEHIDILQVFASYIDSAASKCVAKGTRIHTNSGVKNIEDIGLWDKNKPDTFTLPKSDYYVFDEDGEKQKITQFYYGGKKDCVTITFKNGVKITTALTHKFKTQNGWVTVNDLVKGDLVQRRLKSIDIEKYNEDIPKIPSEWWHKMSKFSFPTKITEEFATFIGMWISDGSVSKNSISICEKDDNVKAKIQDLMDYLFPDKYSNIQTDKRSGVRNHIINSRVLVKFFKTYFGNNCVDKKLPDWMLNMSKENKIAFLNGVTLDGYLRKQDYCNTLILYEGYSKTLVEQISEILCTLGYEYRIGKRYVKTGRLSKYTYSVTAYLTDDKINPIEEHKKKYTVSYNKNKKLYIDTNELDLSLKPNERPEKIDCLTWRNYKKTINNNRGIRQTFAEKLKNEMDFDLGHSSDLSLVEISDISDVFSEETFDIEVENTHSYLISGFVSHNTINCPEDYSYEEFKDVYKYAHESRRIKGVTTYRAGTMASVLAAVDSGTKEKSKNKHTKRPDSVDCDIHIFRADNEEWMVLVGILNDLPLEIFALKQTGISFTQNLTKGKLEKVEAEPGEQAKYNLVTDYVVISDIQRYFERPEHEALTRMISCNLKNGTDISEIYRQLVKSHGSVLSFSKAIARTLSMYVNEWKETECKACGDPDGVVFMEGCLKCKNCGDSKCL